MQTDNKEPGGTILVVTPDPAERNNLTSILQDAGYAVQYSTHDTMVKAATQYKPCLIILDSDQAIAPYPLPYMNALHNDPNTRGLPLLLLITVYGDFDISSWNNITVQRRIVIFRKKYTPEHILWFINLYFTALAKAENTSEAKE